MRSIPTDLPQGQDRQHRTIIANATNDLLKVRPPHDRTGAEIDSGITPIDTTYPPGDIRRYGAVGDDSTDCTAAITAAIDQAESGGTRVYIPEGTFRFNSALTVTSSILIQGCGEFVSILMKNGDFDGITISSGNPIFREFSLSSAGGSDASSGIVVDGNGRTTLSSLFVENQGSHGIEVVGSNIGNFMDLMVTSNGGDGIKVSGDTPVPDTNSCLFINLDLRGNTGWGLNLDVAWANFGIDITTQSNTAGGVRLNNCRQSFFQIYSESNTGPDVLFVDSADCQGNTVFIGEGEVTFGGTTSDRNMVLHGKRQALHDPNFNKVTADKFILKNERQDGTDYTGTMTFEHTANATFTMTFDATNADQLLSFVNGVGGFKVSLQAGNLRANAAATTPGAGAVSIGGTTRTTVGAAGGASALPATPAGYLIINVAGTERQIPYYPVP